jgi:hypothetical protein
MGRDVFATYDDEEGFVICNAAINNKECFTDEIVVHESLVLSCFDTSCVKTAVRILNIALSMDAVVLLLQTAPETTIALNEDKPTAPNTALCLVCDYNKLLLLDTLKAAGGIAWMQDEMRCFSHNIIEDMKVATFIGNMQLELAKVKDSEFSTFTYSCKDIIYRDHANNAYHIYICIHDEVQVSSDKDLPCESTPKIISHNRSGAYNKVDIMLKQHNSTAPPTELLSLQMRRGSMSMLGSKRKRPNLIDHY